MTMENNEEYEGVTLNVNVDGWPAELVGLIIKEQIVYIKDGIVKVVGDPIWSTELPEE